MNVSYGYLTDEVLTPEQRRDWHASKEPGVGEPGATTRRPPESRNGRMLLAISSRMPRA